MLRLTPSADMKFESSHYKFANKFTCNNTREQPQSGRELNCMKARINVSKSVLTLLLSSALRAEDREPRGILQTRRQFVPFNSGIQVIQRNLISSLLPVRQTSVSIRTDGTGSVLLPTKGAKI